MAIATETVAQQSLTELNSKPHWWPLLACSLASCAKLLEPPTWVFQPPEASPFGASWTTYNLAASLATLVSLAFLLLGGTLGDVHGRRLVYLIGIGGSVVANLLLLLSPDTTWFVVTRMLAGVFGALVLPLSLAMIMLNYRDRDRAIAFAVYVVVTVIAGIGSAILGLIMNSAFDWRMAFIAPTLLGMIAFVMCRRFTTESKVPEGEHINGVTHAILTLVILSLVYGIVATRFAAEYLPIVVIASVSIAVIGSVFLIWWTHTRPMARLVSGAARWGVLVAFFAFGIAMQFALVVFASKVYELFTTVYDLSTVAAAVALSPFLLGMVVVILFSLESRIPFSPSVIMCGTMGIVGLVCLVTAIFHLAESYFWLAQMLFIAGAAIILGTTTWLALFFRSIPGQVVGVRAGINVSISQIGLATGMALASAVMMNVGLADYKSRLLAAGVPPARIDDGLTALTALLDPAVSDPAQLPPDVANGLLEGYKLSYLAAFERLLIVVGAFCFLATILAWFAARQVTRARIEREGVQQLEQAQA